MNIAILGKGRGLDDVRAECARAGCPAVAVEEPDGIRSISGHPGAFVIRTEGGALDASYIIMLASDSPSPAALPEGALALADEAALSELPRGSLPVAFVLDHPADAPARDVRDALEWAAHLAARKYRVVYLARHVRTAGEGLEALYRRAREAGVLFYRYDAISLGRADGAFHVELADGADRFAIDAGSAVFSAPRAGDAAYARLAKLLRLKTDERGLNEGRYHLFPVKTSRRGVYFLDPALCSDERELRARVRAILAEVSRDALADAQPERREALIRPDGYADVDAEKCAFCYTCYRVCPHAAMAPDAEASAMKNVRENCSGCGICAAICPAGAIAMEGRDGGAEIEAGHLTVFCCANSGAPALEAIGEGEGVTAVKVSCGGELKAEAILSALAGGGRALVAVCADDACRHFEGNKRAKKQVERAKAMLRASKLDDSRVGIVQLSHASPGIVEEAIREMARVAAEETAT